MCARARAILVPAFKRCNKRNEKPRIASSARRNLSSHSVSLSLFPSPLSRSRLPFFFFLEGGAYEERQWSAQVEFNSTKQPRIPTPRNLSHRRFPASTFLRSNIRAYKEGEINADENREYPPSRGLFLLSDMSFKIGLCEKKSLIM